MFRTILKFFIHPLSSATLAQSAERAAFNRVVGGSSPPSGA